MRSSRILGKWEVFDILDSKQSNRVLGLKYGMSHSSISKIRRGLTYQDYHRAFRKHERWETKAISEVTRQTHAKGHYYLDSKFLRISLDDILVSLDLSNKKLVDIEFNAVIKGESIEYTSALMLMQEKGYLK
jgi:hypothetical protein